MAIKKGDQVRKVVPDIVGEVIGAELDANLEKMFLVAFKDANGEDHQRYFHESELILEAPAEL